MKIVMINAVCESGSTGAICKELVDSFSKNGNKCVIYYGNRSSNYAFAQKIANKFEVRINSLLARFTGLQGYFAYLGNF